MKAVAQNNSLVTPEVETARKDPYEKQLEEYLRHYLVEEYEARSDKAWNRDYSSADALERSVKPNRSRWEEVLGPPLLTKSGPLERKPYALGEIQAEWIELPLGMLTAEAVLAFPVGASDLKKALLLLFSMALEVCPKPPFLPGPIMNTPKRC